MSIPLRFIRAAKMVADIMLHEQFFCTVQDFGKVLLDTDDDSLILRITQQTRDIALRVGDESYLNVKYTNKEGKVYMFIYTSERISRGDYVRNLLGLDDLYGVHILYIIYSNKTPMPQANVTELSKNKAIEKINQIHIDQMSIDTSHHTYAVTNELIPSDDRDSILSQLGIATHMHLPIIRDDDMAIVFKGWLEEGRIVRQITKGGNITYRRILHKPRNYELVRR